jgi:DNA-binding transcriptional MerR regulator
MNNFSIKDIERLSGIKAHTLRIWEQRHSMSLCKRKESQHRYYDNEDLKHILRIAYLYHNGYKISRIARLSEDEIKNQVNINADESDYDLLIHHLVEASIDYDQFRFEKLLNNSLAQLGFEKFVVQICYPFFEKIGFLWMTEHVLPAHEHFSSYLIQKKIIVAIDELEQKLNNQYTVLIFAPSGEHHEIPLLVMQYLFKKHGTKTIYFGCNIAVPDLEYYCMHQRPTHLYVHLITNFLNQQAGEYIHFLLTKFPQQKLIISGPAFTEIKSSFENITILRSCEDMMELVRVWSLESGVGSR